jgi:trans-aconitate methyltransferase
MQRKQHWEQVYRDRQPGEVSWYQAHPEYSLDLIAGTGLGKTGAIIDVGGGASRLVDRLLAAGYQDVTVLDIAGAALDHARTRLGPRADRVTWLEGDVTAFRPARPYALWHDRAVFHFLTDPGDRRRYRDILLQALPAGAHAVIATFAPDGPSQCSSLPVARYDAQQLQTTLGNGFELLETRREAHLTPAGKTQHFLYFCLRRVPLAGDRPGQSSAV